MSSAKLLIRYKCPVCGAEGSYVPDEKDLSQLKETGIASFSVYHKDHVLVIWFDKEGSVRAYDVFKAIEAKDIAPKAKIKWNKINKSSEELENISFILADKDKGIYSDLFFKGDASVVLRLIEAIDEPKTMRIDEADYFIIPLDSLFFIVGGRIPKEKLDKIVQLFKLTAEFNIVEDEIAQYVIGYTIEEFVKTKEYTLILNAIEIIHHLKDKITINKEILLQAKDIGIEEIDKDLVDIISKITAETLKQLIESLIAADKKSLLLLINHFATLKYFNILKIHSPK